MGGDQTPPAAGRAGARAIVNPYTPLRAASNIALPSADAVEPPVAITLTALNCEAPVNTSSDITHACATDAAGGHRANPEHGAERPDHDAEREAGRRRRAHLGVEPVEDHPGEDRDR